MNKKYKPKKERKKKSTPQPNKYKMNHTVGNVYTTCRHCRKRVSLNNAWSCCWKDKYNSAWDARMGKAMQIDIENLQEKKVDLQVDSDGES